MTDILNPEIVVAILAMIGVITTGILASRSSSAQVQVNLIQTLHDRVRVLEDRVGELWDARQADALVKRMMGDFIDVLEDHIWRGKGPPPPTRPDNI